MIADLAKAAGVLGMDVSMDVDVDVHRANASDHRVAVAGRLAAAVGPPPGVVDSNANAVSALRRWVPEYAPTGANAELIGGVSESFETQFLEDFDTSAADASRLHVCLEAVPTHPRRSCNRFWSPTLACGSNFRDAIVCQRLKRPEATPPRPAEHGS